MGSKGKCAVCGEAFEVNPRARRTHACCCSSICQAERKRRAQKSRRARGGPRTSRAGYMKAYRATRPDYRRREAALAATRRQRIDDVGAEAEVEGGPWPASVQVVGGAEVHVVTEAGFTLKLAGANGWTRVVTKPGETPTGQGLAGSVKPASAQSQASQSLEARRNEAG